MRYLALLRGINVGGKNIVKMADLREAMKESGLEDVATYIQSGNVVFGAPRQPRAKLAKRLETDLTERFGIELKVVLLTEAQLGQVVEEAPPLFGDEKYRCDVLFVRAPLTVSAAMAVVETREGVDQAWAGPGVVYFARLDAKASGSRLAKIVAKPEYKNMTIRNWRTTQKLLDLLGG